MVRHLAIILDGNRRFARRIMQEPWKGHEYGRDKIEKFLDWSKDLGIKELTFYTFSIQNFRRPKREFDYLMHLIKESFESFMEDERVEKYGIRVNVIGRYKLFPKDVVQSIESVMSKTRKNKNFVVNFALAYGGREEITDAIKKIASQVRLGVLDPKNITEKTIEKNLYMASEPDIIIRTGGEVRTSNFLMWQSSYSEWFFLEKMWPEFTRADLVQVLKEFSQRERRYGR